MSLVSTDLPRRHRLTVSDYYRMAEVGILAPDARVELIDGDIIDMPPPGSLHAAAVHRLTEILIRAAGNRASVLAQNPVRTSLRFDRDTKVSLYAVHAIPEMWLVDLRGRRLVRHRAPQQGSYTLIDEPDPGTPLSVSALTGVAVDLQSLFGT